LQQLQIHAATQEIVGRTGGNQQQAAQLLAALLLQQQQQQHAGRQGPFLPALLPTGVLLHRQMLHSSCHCSFCRK